MVPTRKLPIKPWTLPIVVIVGMCFVVFNSAGYVHCYHNSAPSPEAIFGWPNVYFTTTLTQSQWKQVRVDFGCAHGKPISARELPADPHLFAMFDHSALLANAFSGLMLLGFTTLVCELWQRAFKTRAITIRDGLLLTTLVAIFIPLSRSGFLFLYFTRYIVFILPEFRLILILAVFFLPLFLLVLARLRQVECARI